MRELIPNALITLGRLALKKRLGLGPRGEYSYNFSTSSPTFGNLGDDELCHYWPLSSERPSLRYTHYTSVGTEYQLPFRAGLYRRKKTQEPRIASGSAWITF